MRNTLAGKLGKVAAKMRVRGEVLQPLGKAQGPATERSFQRVGAQTRAQGARGWQPGCTGRYRFDQRAVDSKETGQLPRHFPARHKGRAACVQQAPRLLAAQGHQGAGQIADVGRVTPLVGKNP